MKANKKLKEAEKLKKKGQESQVQATEPKEKKSIFFDPTLAVHKGDRFLEVSGWFSHSVRPRKALNLFAPSTRKREASGGDEEIEPFQGVQKIT